MKINIDMKFLFEFDNDEVNKGSRQKDVMGPPLGGGMSWCGHTVVLEFLKYIIHEYDIEFGCQAWFISFWFIFIFHLWFPIDFAKFHQI